MSILDPQPAAKRLGMGTILAICGVAGAVSIGSTMTTGGLDSAGVPVEATEEYGRRLLLQTPELLGPDVADPDMRYMKSRLACTSCHLDAGVSPGTLSLNTADERYPRFSARSASEGDMMERINGCMVRSMNGRALPLDSPELIAMAAYVKSLALQTAATGAGQLEAHEQPDFQMPERAVNLTAGERVFNERCAKCHGAEGQGVLAETDPIHGYALPPLWGPDSYNNGAGMNRVLTAARFIKARMPLGEADLSDAQAFDVAGYIDSKPRPEMEGLEADYPDKTTKPVDSPYAPWADPFPAEQHRLGPFRPIQEYYEQLKAQ